MAGKGYSIREKRDILEYIVEKNAYLETKGKILWTDYANSGKTTRTWQSLKEVFLKRILPDLRNPYYNLKPDIVLNFNSAYKADGMHKDRRPGEWIKTNNAASSSKTSKSETSTRSKSGESQKSSAGSQDSEIEKKPESGETLENGIALELRSNSTTPDLQIDESLHLSPPEQTMSSAIPNLNSSNGLDDVISFVNHTCEDKATCPHCSIDANADKMSTHSFDVVEMLECSGEESKKQSQSSIESELRPPSQAFQALESLPERAATPAELIRQRTLNKIKMLTSLLGEDMEPFLRRQPGQSLGDRQRDEDSSDSSISEILDHIMNLENRAKKSRRGAAAKPKEKPGHKRAVKPLVVKKSPPKPKKSPKVAKSKSVSVATSPLRVEVEEVEKVAAEKAPASERRDVAVQAEPPPAAEAASVSVSSPPHQSQPSAEDKPQSNQHKKKALERDLDNLFGFASDLDEILPLPHVESHVETQADVQTVEAPKELAALPRGRPQEKQQEKRTSKDEDKKIKKKNDEKLQKKDKDKKRRNDLENLFGFSSGQVKAKSSRTDRPKEVTDKRRASSDIEQQDFAASGRNQRDSEKSSDESERNIRINNRRRHYRLSGPRNSTFESNLLAMWGGCLYPVYGGLPDNLRIVKWVPKISCSKRHSRSRCSTCSTGSDSDQEASTSAVKQNHRSSVRSTAVSLPINEKEFATVELEKQYCQAVLRYYKNGSKGLPPRKSDYQNVPRPAESKRKQSVNYLDSDEEPDCEVVEAVGENNDRSKNGNGIKDFVKKLSNMDPTDDKAFWKTMSEMLQRKMHNDQKSDDVVNTEPVEPVEMPKRSSDEGRSITKQNAEVLSKKRCTASDIPAIVIEAPLIEQTEEIVSNENKDKDVSKGKKPRTSSDNKKSTPKRSPTRAKHQADVETIKAANKAPKYSIAIQKYGEDMASYVIENTQTTDLFISAMDNLKNALQDGSSKIKEPPIVGQQPPKNSPASKIIKQQNMELVDLTTDSLTPTMQSVWEKERPIFEAIARSETEDMEKCLSEAVNAEKNNNAIDNIVPGLHATKNAKPNTKTKDQTDQAVSDVNAVSEERRSSRKRTANTRLSQPKTNRSRKSLITTMAETELPAKEINTAVASSPKPIVPDDKEVSSDGSKISKPVIDLDNQHKTSLQAVNKEQLEEIKTSEIKVTSANHTGDSKQPESQPAVGAEDKESTKQVAAKDPQAKGPNSRATAQKRTKKSATASNSEAEGATIRKSLRSSVSAERTKNSPRKSAIPDSLSHLTRAAIRAVKDGSTRGRMQNGDDDEQPRYAEEPIFHNFKSLHDCALLSFSNFDFSTGDDRPSEVYETMADIRVPKDVIKNAGSPVSYTSETDPENRECFESCHISMRRGSNSNSDVIDSIDRLVLEGFEPDITEDLSSEDQQTKSALKSKCYLKKKKVSFKQIDTITEETIIIEPIDGIQDTELLEALNTIRNHSVSTEHIYVLDADEDPDATVIIEQTKPTIKSHKKTVIISSSSDKVAGKIAPSPYPDGDNHEIIQSLPDDENESDFFTPSAMSSVEKLSEKSSNTPFYSPISSPSVKIDSISPENVKPSPQTLTFSLLQKMSNWYLFSSDDSQDSPIATNRDDQPIQNHDVPIKTEELLNNNTEINSCRNRNEA